MSSETSVDDVVEKPQNGLAGLKHWRHDLMAGLLVSLTSLPFSLGIAIASGSPPIAGLMSAIIAGLIFPFLGGAYVTISGPAAGLAPALFAAMLALGHGNREIGYPLLLAVICVVGAIQVVLSLLGAARLSAVFPVAVVEGMLASIGLLIIAKELPHFLGQEFRAHDFFSILAEAPSQFARVDPHILGMGGVCLAMMFGLSHPRIRSRLPVPAPVLVVAVGVVLGLLFGIDDSHRISIPDNILKHGIVLPNFPGLFADRSLAWVIVTAVLTLVLIDGTESLATIKAIDRIDPFKRRSSPDRTLLAMGISNMMSSLAGGLTIIPGGVKSKLCIVSGGRTLWANFYNACFLLLYLFAGKALINLIPYSALAAILIYTGYKMCEPAVWRHVAHIGREQLFLFATTVVVTLATDLLVGIGVGMAVKLLLGVVTTVRHDLARKAVAPAAGIQHGIAMACRFFANPVGTRERLGDCYVIRFNGPLVCFNIPHLNRELRRIPADVSDVVLYVGERVAMIDHTTCDNLMYFIEQHRRSGRGRAELIGIEHMHKTSSAATSRRLAAVPIDSGTTISGPHPCI
ncbi:SulP family inorganic anion transporter [Paludisphaera mucosa]|uniref:SulP family inorganic anion transporter n=1 Tax=Paludisphaera mucosa TaxID=3030827 RepID=A0ABT6FLM0_9BACT|nr:SulP family inorganic anion transporter [Paludisphaera mucosa]MDG3008260.1 SulP family inorganic anion transporter [Paludisphaera mucosa]